MLKRPSEQRLTLEERVAVVVAIVAAIGIHVALFLVGSGIGRLAGREASRERVMVVRRMRDLPPPIDVPPRPPDPRRVRVPAEPAGPEGKAGGTPPPAPKSPLRRAEPAPAQPEAPAMEVEIPVATPPDEGETLSGEPGAEAADNAVSVVTDLPAASFTISGPVSYQGGGTLWIRRGAPAGTYRVAFGTVDGFGTPPPQTKQLAEKGQIVFVGKYRRSTEVSVGANAPGALFTIYRPDGRPLDLSQPGRVLLDDLPPGTYTAVFKDVPGYTAPRPTTQTLIPGGRLAFQGDYKAVQAAVGGRGGSAAGSGPPGGAGTGSRGSGSGGGGGAGTGRGKAPAPRPEEPGLDRRVQLVVTSYPPTDIEDDYSPIAYPEVVIRKSNFQQGWCQVYLVLSVNDRGVVEGVSVERPRPDSRAPYEALIAAVEKSVREWDYDKVRAEVHVDARFYVE